MAKLFALCATLAVLAAITLMPTSATPQGQQFNTCNKKPDVDRVQFLSLSARAITCANAADLAEKLVKGDKTPGGYSCSGRNAGVNEVSNFACTGEGSKGFKTSYRRQG